MEEAPPAAHAPADSVRLPLYHKEDYHPELYEAYWMINETNNRIHTIIEDKTGKLWFGTGGDVCIYDARLNGEVGQGKTYTSLTKKYGRTLTRVHTIIEDKKGNIWFSGGGLWWYDGRTFTNFTRNSVGMSTKTGKETFGLVHEVIMAQVGHFRVMMRNPCLMKSQE